MMRKKIGTSGTIATPKTAPHAGFYESLVFLDQNGYFHDTQQYVTAMARAGLRCINSRSEQPPIYGVSGHPDGLFNEGVSPLGKDLLQILAYEGFEGEVRDLVNNTVYILSKGRMMEYVNVFEDDESFKSIRRVA
jgi:hypothetical protein